MVVKTNSHHIEIVAMTNAKRPASTTPLDPTQVALRLVDVATDRPFLLRLFASTQQPTLALPNLLDLQFNAQQAHYEQTFAHAVHQLILWDGLSYSPI